MSKQLYKLTDEFRTFESLLNRIDSGEQPYIRKEDVEECLANVKIQIEDKVENIGKVFLSNKADISSLDNEIKRLQDRKQALVNTNDWLRNYLLTEMLSSSITRVKRDILTVYISKSQPSIEIEDLELIPDEFKKITVEAKKYEIKKYFEDSGEVVLGTRVLSGKEFVVIR